MKKTILSGLFAGVAMLIVGMIFSWLFNWLFPSVALEYQNPGLFRPWSDPLMSLYFLYPFILGLILSFLWNKHKLSPNFGGSVWKKGATFGAAYWVVASIPGMFISYSSLQVSLLMVIGWSISGLINAIVAGWILARWNK